MFQYDSQNTKKQREVSLLYRIQLEFSIQIQY